VFDPERLKELVGKFPVPAAKDGKLAEVDKEATDAAVAELLKDPRGAVLGLVGLLAPPEKGGDTRARHALHAVVIRAGAVKGETRRQVAEALASALSTDRPTEVKAFALRQLQLVGGEEVAPAVGKLLTDEALGEDAAQALLAIKAGAAGQLRAALPKAKGRQAVVIAQALGSLRDAESAGALRKLLAVEDRDARLTAAWALANIGDAGAAEQLLKAADAAQGYERAKLTQACLLLAETLLAVGKKKEAVTVYGHLGETRTDPAEKHVRDAAARGLAAAK
jgi:hypothetical protein